MIVAQIPLALANRVIAAWVVARYAHGHATDYVVGTVPGVQAAELHAQTVVPGVQAVALLAQKAVPGVPAAELPVQIIAPAVPAVVAAVLRVLMAVPVVTDVPAVVPEAAIADAPANVRAVRATAQALVPQSV